ncbi:uncharacterized protein LOC121233545 [Aquila chrysaetos chrysaetos]|uniref:uncharacterized protein LOC121233545 n=1 Tax=Aquila chrysaetos chrysaetos TaxID=223781 RepID=UPI001B7D2D53|nr:uncharacterized protein LOC121233545 [Aquila chrysaetos chrysaetos]
MFIRSAWRLVSLGRGWFPAGAPKSFPCRPGLSHGRAGSGGAVPRHCRTQAGCPPGLQWADTAQTPDLPACACRLRPSVPFRRAALPLRLKWKKAKIKNHPPPPSGTAANTSSCKSPHNGHCCVDLTSPVDWVSACQAGRWISRKPRDEAGSFAPSLWPDAIRRCAADKDHDRRPPCTVPGEEQKPLIKRSCCCRQGTDRAQVDVGRWGTESMGKQQGLWASRGMGEFPGTG